MNNSLPHVVNSKLKLVYRVYALDGTGANYIYVEPTNFSVFQEAKQFYDGIELEEEGEVKSLLLEVVNNDTVVELSEYLLEETKT